MFRLLLDVNERGLKVLAKLFGVPNLKLTDSWNGGTAAEPHVGSILLTYDMLTSVAVFALLENGCDEVYTWPGRVIGFEANDPAELRQRYLARHKEGLGRRFSYGGGTGRNVHQMTGRVE